MAEGAGRVLGLSKIINFFANHGQSAAGVTVEIVRAKINIVVDTTRVCAVIGFGSRPWGAAVTAK